MSFPAKFMDYAEGIIFLPISRNRFWNAFEGSIFKDTHSFKLFKIFQTIGSLKLPATMIVLL